MNLVHRLLSSVLKYLWLVILPLGCLALGANYFIPIDAFAATHLKAEATIANPIRVTSAANNGVGSLRWAINQANEYPNDDLIELSGISGAIVLSSRLPKITSNLMIVGNGNDIISGNHAHQVLAVERGAVTLSHLTIADGLAQGSSGRNGVGGSAGMGGGLLIKGGMVTLDTVRFVNNKAIGGEGTAHNIDSQRTEIQPFDRQQRDPQPNFRAVNSSIQTSKSKFKVNRGAILGVNGVSFTPDPLDAKATPITIGTHDEKLWANRGAIAGMNGIGIGGIGSIAFAGGGGFGGFGNAGNGGNGGNAGANSGNGGDGGDGGNGGVGIFGRFGLGENQGGIGTVAFGGGGGFGGFGNAGNGGNGGNTSPEMANGGNGGSGGNGGFGGGGGAGGLGGFGGTVGHAGNPGQGGFGGSAGGLGFSGSGGGFGGAIFIRAGRLILRDTAFEHNAAIGGAGIMTGQGKGGAIFVVTEDLKEQIGRLISPKVISLKQLPQFVENVASDAGQTSIDNADIYGIVDVE